VKVVVYPADKYGCGYHRMIWPAQELQRQGHDIEIVMPENRKLSITMKGRDEVVSVALPEGTDVVVFQRMTHRVVVGVIKWCAENGIATVIDVDDDLSSIHPSNPAVKAMNLSYLKGGKQDRRLDKNQTHSWQYLAEASKYATVMQVSTPALLDIYGKHRPTRVVSNYLSDLYFNPSLHHVDSTMIGWPASLHSHPNDPQVMGGVLRQLMAEGADFVVTAEPQAVERAFGLTYPARYLGSAELEDWPAMISQLGIGIVPLANSKFNRSKSWLKGLELAAVGVPWVASPREEYRALHARGCGMLAAGPKEWLTSLRSLCADQSLRSELSEAGRAVASELRLRDHAWRFWEVWAEAQALVRR
jgi:hypothetical protein